MVKYNKVIDSGKRRKFGKNRAVRDVSTGKGRYDLISPIAMQRLADHYENGATKYDPRNWEKGMPLSVFLDSMERHMTKFREGHREEDHMSAVGWNAFGLIHTEEMIKRGLLPKEFDDLPNYLKKKKK